MRLLAILLFALALPAQDSTAWKNLEFLLGDWIAVGGQGTCSFSPELSRKVIVRRNDSTDNKGVRHEDLMVIYTDPSPRAVYFDSEGHIIRYNLTFPSPNSAIFESEASQPGPRYRLSYAAATVGSATGKFEIAPPGGAYKPYLSWSMTKKATAPYRRP